jgi:hypothetical protein
MVVREFRFVVCAGIALSVLAGFGPVAARASSAASLPSIVHSPPVDALSSASGRTIAGLAAPDALTPDGSVWSGQKVIIDDGAQEDFFGWSVAIDGQTALVGAYGVTVNGQEQQGAAYVFTESNGIWTQTATLIANDGVRFDIFGSAVALSGSVAAIGAYQSNHSIGAVYVFTGSGSAWTQKAKLTADDGVRNDCLGWSVAVSSAGVLAGAPFASVDGIQVGAVYAFGANGGSWSQTQKVVANNGAIGDFFGDAIAMDGTVAAIGADSATIDGHQVQGAAYVFDSSAGSWVQKTELTSDDGAPFDNFGRFVAISGTTIFVGTPYAVIDGNAFEGAVYVFDGAGGTWGQTQKLIASDGAANGYFGWSVAVSGTTALIGANSYSNNTNPGLVYKFDKSSGIWAQTQELASGDGTGVDLFGWSVALDGTNAVVGEPFAQVHGVFAQGAAYFYAPASDAIFANGFD